MLTIMNHSDKYWDQVDFWLWVSTTLLFNDSCSLIADEILSVEMVRISRFVDTFV